MAVYGDQLAFFSEQFRMYNYFSMKPLATASYSKRVSLGKIKGVFQFMKKGELTKEPDDTLADINVPTLWTRQKLNVGYYFIEKEGEVFRIKNPSDWSFEGGFNVYVLETVAGNIDTQKPFEDVNLGQNDYE